MNLAEKIKAVRNSIVAVGFSSEPGKVTIKGSGFTMSDDGKILTAAHLFRAPEEEQRGQLMCMAMTKHEGKLDRYAWLPATLVKKDDENDVALLQIGKYKDTLLSPLETGDAEEVEEGQSVYFIGFPYAARLINEGMGVTLLTNKGIISSIKRKAADPHLLDWFIVDAISNPGNSGCPLIDIETNKVIGTMSISFRTKSEVNPDLDIREPMHIAGAKPIDSARGLLR